MASVHLKIVLDNFHATHALHIQQGEVAAGREPLSTILKSCVCIGFYHAATKTGAISHITGFSENQGHGARGALRLMRKQLARLGVETGNCECFLIGGAEKARHVYDDSAAFLHKEGITFRELDILGRFHRKLLFDPSTGLLTLFKKHDSEIHRENAKTFSSDLSYDVFHDKKRRLITGASLFFRNPALLEFLVNRVAPEVLAKSATFHVWCAGCSLGMETYSVGMVLLDCLWKQNARNIDLRILGTDISADALQTASEGVYKLSERAMREHPQLIQKYTARLDIHTIRIIPELRGVVSFKQRDIRLGSRSHQFEMVVCDHVLQYFTVDIQLEFLKGLLSGVKRGGFLYVSSPSKEIETTLLATGNYAMLGKHFFQRTS